MKSEDSHATKAMKALTRMSSSMLAAILTFQFLHAAGVVEIWHIPLTGVGAHMGTEALKYMGEVYKKRLGIDEKPKE